MDVWMDYRRAVSSCTACSFLAAAPAQSVYGAMDTVSRRGGVRCVAASRGVTSCNAPTSSSADKVPLRSDGVGKRTGALHSALRAALVTDVAATVASIRQFMAGQHGLYAAGRARYLQRLELHSLADLADALWKEIEPGKDLFDKVRRGAQSSTAAPAADTDSTPPPRAR